MSTGRSRESGDRLTKSKPAVVIDTGVLVSAFVFGGVPAEAVRKAFRSCSISLSPDLLQEYRDVPSELLREHKITFPQFRSLIAGIAAVVTRARVFKPRKRLAICRDPKDDMLLECCLAAKAKVLVTGDKDLLELQGLPFPLATVSPKQFMAISILND
jgi:uncharacterized protein